MSLQLVKQVRVCEVGPRDGLQNEKVVLTTQEKISLVDAMTDAGLPVIEVGSFVSPKAVPQLADTDAVFAGIHKKPGVEYRALIANLRGVDRAIACGCTKVKLNVSASTAHNLANLNCTPAQSVAGFENCVQRAKGAGIGISGSVSMAFGSPWDREIPLQDVKAIVEAYWKAGVDEISLSDASGMAYPTQVYHICSEMKRCYPQIRWWLHFHNTRGLALANILAGMQAGFDRYDASSAGVGGCPFVPGAAGNVATEDMLHMCSEMGIETGVDLDRVIDIGRSMTSLLGHAADSYLLRAGRSKDLFREIPTGQLKNQTLKK